MNLNFKVLGSDIQNNKTTIGKQNLAIKPRIKENYQREGRILLLRCSVNPTPKGGANSEHSLSILVHEYYFWDQCVKVFFSSNCLPLISWSCEWVWLTETRLGRDQQTGTRDLRPTLGLRSCETAYTRKEQEFYIALVLNNWYFLVYQKIKYLFVV